MSSNRICTEVVAALYVLSGISQPLLISTMKNAGIADPSAQLYMFFYYAGPSLFLITFWLPRFSDPSKPPPSLRVLTQCAGVALFDITAQILNYTGAGLAGATIFAIVYSSVTIWTALFNRIFLQRRLTPHQWGSIGAVFIGLCLTAWNATNPATRTSSVPVAWGTICILVGSCMHGGFYVMSDAIMQPLHESSGRHFLYPREMTALQSAVACFCLGLWQLVYTWPRWHELVDTPMRIAGTTIWGALRLFLLFACANMLHASTFFFTIAHYPGGSTSAGVFKGLQAVLVFVVAHWMFCDSDTPEMCWSLSKLISLIMVVTGVIIYNAEQRHKPQTEHSTSRARTSYDSISTTTV